MIHHDKIRCFCTKRNNQQTEEGAWRVDTESIICILYGGRGLMSKRNNEKHQEEIKTSNSNGHCQGDARQHVHLRNTAGSALVIYCSAW